MNNGIENTNILGVTEIITEGGISGAARVLPNQFPQLSRKYNGKRIVYLDNGATTLKPQRVVDAVNNYNAGISSNVHRGANMLAEYATNLFEDTREKVRHLINAASLHEIVFTTSTTDSINLVAQCYGGLLQAGDEIIVTVLEHHANIVPWQFLEKSRGIKLRVIPLMPDGRLDMAVYHSMLNSRTKLVSVAHTSNALGVISPLQEIIDAAHSVGAKVLVDGAQAVGHSKVDVQSLDIDFLVFSGHKIYAPTGVGVLYGKYDLLDKMPPYRGGGEMIVSVKFSGTTFKPPPTRFEAGTPPIAEVIGLGEAIDFIQEISYPEIGRLENELLKTVKVSLAAIPQIKILGNVGPKVPVFSFLVDGIHSHDVGFVLNSEGVAIRTGRHCAEPLMDFFGIPGTARASFSFYNTSEDVNALVAGIKKCIELFKPA